MGATLVKEAHDYNYVKNDTQREKLLSNVPIPPNLTKQSPFRFLARPAKSTMPEIMPPAKGSDDEVDQNEQNDGKSSRLAHCVCGLICNPTTGYLQCYGCHQQVHKDCVTGRLSRDPCPFCRTEVGVRDVVRKGQLSIPVRLYRGLLWAIISVLILASVGDVRRVWENCLRYRFRLVQVILDLA